MGCTFRARVNHLWSVWYTVLVTLLHVYLLYLGFERYKLYTEMKWPHGGYPRIQLSAYIALHAICIPASLLFMAFGAFKSGNLAGDNDRLGARLERVVDVGNAGCCLKKMKALWLHSPPLPQSLHLFMAFALLVAQQLMLAQLYRHGFLHSGEFLSTEMDFLYNRGQVLLRNLPMGDSHLQSFRIRADELNALPIGPKLLPILMHARLFGIPLEFANFLLALFAFAVAYPAVFWRANKLFSFVFSVHLLLHMAAAVYGYLGFSIIYRIQETNYLGRQRPSGLGQYLSTSQPIVFYHPHVVLATYIASAIVIYVASIALYGYGYNKFHVNWLALRSRAPAVIANGGGGDLGSPRSESVRRRNHARASAGQLCCDGYGPHISAIVLLLIMVVLKAPTLYALMVLYQNEAAPLLLSCIVVDVVYLFAWILLWLALTLKRDWDFTVAHSVHEIIALQQADRAAKHAGKTPATTTTSGSRQGSPTHKSASELKNALLLMHGEEMYITDDPLTKQSVLRQAQKYGLGPTQEEVYWLKPNLQSSQSPTTRKIPLDESAKNTPEMGRLLAGQPVQQAIHRSDSRDTGSPTVAYQTIGHRPTQQQQLQQQQQQQQRVLASYQRYSDSSPPDDRPRDNVSTFGTLPRGVDPRRPPNGRDTRLSNQGSLVGTEFHYSSRPPLPTTQGMITPDYASIHKAQRAGSAGASSAVIMDGSVPTSSSRDLYARIPQQPINEVADGDPGQMSRGSSYANIPSGYATYASYQRIPQARVIGQAGVPIAQQQQQHRTNGNAYPYGRRPSADGYVPVTNVRQSPQLGERSSAPRTLEQSPYQRATGVKNMSSFSDMQKPLIDGAAVYNVAPGSREATPSSVGGSSTLTRQHQQQQQNQLNNASSHVTWSGNPLYQASLASSSQADPLCFTPSSTLTSQGSYQLTPTTAGSPSNAVYSTVGNGSYGGNGRTAGKTPSSGHKDDSANFSLTSSNDSGGGGGHRQTPSNGDQYATSIV